MTEEWKSKLIFQGDDGLWYWPDEVFADLMGPYETYEEAAKAMRKYVEYLDKGEVGRA